KEMLSNVGVSVFIFGNKIDNETKTVIDASGMIEEFNISVANGAIPIPVGATGFTSKALWQKVMGDFDAYVGIEELKSLYADLGDESKTPEELIETIIKIINQSSRH
ncbi:hypothetical protein J4G37_34970, partial [Microvirga sp. 3-52]|nr:hypothetical protein [Microvirga sp. 3-52]